MRTPRDGERVSRSGVHAPPTHIILRTLTAEPCPACMCCAQDLSQGCGSRASVAPAASVTPVASGRPSYAYGRPSYAYGSRRRSAAAEEAHELEEDGWADEARGIFREHLPRASSSSRSRRPPARCGARSFRLPPRSRLTTRGCASGCVARPREQRMRVRERRAQRPHACSARAVGMRIRAS